MKNHIIPIAFRLLAITPLLALCFSLPASAQSEANDEALRYQQQRMVFQQWDQDKFKPGKGFLSLNPYYWLVWGLFHPNYHKTDLRPLSATGPQTQRLAFVAAMSNTDSQYKLQSDTIKNTSLSLIAGQSGLIADADPLWTLYYKDQFAPVLNSSAASLLGNLPAPVTQKLLTEGTYSWYKNELAILKERLQGARSTNMDRGSRIMAYYRLLKDYRTISGVWAVRIASAQSSLAMTAQQRALAAGFTGVPGWTPSSDVQIANKILLKVK